jgi:hypothetical protein
LEALDFLRRFNEEAYKAHPDIQTTKNPPPGLWCRDPFTWEGSDSE